MNRLKELREEAMTTVRELSERSGVSEDTITKIENGHRKGRSMTLRKLAKALGVEPHQLSPEQFAQEAEYEVLPQEEHFGSEMPHTRPPETGVQDAHTLSAAIWRAFLVISTVEAQSGLGAQRDLEHLTEEQRDVLLAVSHGGKMTPSTVAQQVRRDVDAVNHDLASLRKLRLVWILKSGESRTSPRGELVAGVLDQGTLHYDEALRHVSTLMKAYEPLAAIKPSRLAEEDARLFFSLQKSVVRTIKGLVNEAAPDAQEVRENVLAEPIEIKASVDPWDLASKVRHILGLYMTSPPSQQAIRADIEGVPPRDVMDALDATGAANRSGRYDVLGEDDERVYKQFLWNLRSTVDLSDPTQATVSLERLLDRGGADMSLSELFAEVESKEEGRGKT